MEGLGQRGIVLGTYPGMDDPFFEVVASGGEVHPQHNVHRPAGEPILIVVDNRELPGDTVDV